jgi:hypothetical protein
MKHSAWWILSLAALVTACAGVPRDDAAVSPLERYMAYAGEPVDRFTYPQRLRSWRPVDRQHLMVQSGVGRFYLLAVEPGCIGLQQSHRLAFTSNVARSTVSSGFDEIRLERDRCRITEIRPLDYDRMREDERAE